MENSYAHKRVDLSFTITATVAQLLAHVLIGLVAMCLNTHQGEDLFKMSLNS